VSANLNKSITTGPAPAH